MGVRQEANVEVIEDLVGSFRVQMGDVVPEDGSDVLAGIPASIWGLAIRNCARGYARKWQRGRFGRGHELKHKIGASGVVLQELSYVENLMANGDIARLG